MKACGCCQDDVRSYTPAETPSLMPTVFTRPVSLITSSFLLKGMPLSLRVMHIIPDWTASNCSSLKTVWGLFGVWDFLYFLFTFFTISFIRRRII